MVHERELEFRRRRFEQIRYAMRSDAGEDSGAPAATKSDHRPELLAELESFRANRDVDSLRAAMHRMSMQPGFSPLFPGFNFGVAMFLNQLCKASPDAEELVGVLLDTLTAPADERDADRKLSRLLTHVDIVRTGAHPAPKSAVICLSFFWWLQHPTQWPALWSTSEDSLRTLAWIRSDLAPADLYPIYRDVVRSLHEDDELVQSTLAWFAAHQWTGLDLALFDRLAWAAELNGLREDDTYPDGLAEVARANVAAALSELRILGDSAERAVAGAVGRDLRRHVANEYWVKATDTFRANAWVKWKPKEAAGWNEAPSVMVLTTDGGLLVGLSPGRRERGWAAGIRGSLSELLPEGMAFLSIGAKDAERQAQAADGTGAAGEYIIGQLLPGDEMLGNPGLLDEVVRVAAATQPVFDRILTLVDPKPIPPPTSGEPDAELATLFEQFIKETGYPTSKDEAHVAHRSEMAKVLEPDALGELDLDDFRRIYNSSSYGFPGNQSVLNITLRDAPPGLADRAIATLQVLLWGEGPVESRIDRCLDVDDLGLKGLGESVVLKLLCICHPDRFIPVFPVVGDNGKIAVLDAIGEKIPEGKVSRGTRQVQANDLLRSQLDPLLPGDPWGQSVFAFWLRDRQVVGPEERLDALVDECYLPDRSFIDELVDLLQDKRQIVLFGPPGTGKTFIARKLAQALAPDERLNRFVQFHPSTSYEDFFEGYRPSLDAGGNLSYSLEQGPFADLADHAAQDSRLHVLVVDELNRANIPKVFGELLFLLEYREERVVPLYRPEGFSLPANLWVIATMNTADRSIASLDAALRRRFHFVPIFPDVGPMAGLLDRYLEREGGDRRWAQLVDMVNGELRDRLGNGDLLIGPSHFMKPDLDEARMAKIWHYNVEPFIDDQFYGDPAAIGEFRWAAVLKRFNATTERESDEVVVE